ncbi:MAG: hypothetical protein AB7F65_05645 [Dehalococcoidia bacterium]
MTPAGRTAHPVLDAVRGGDFERASLRLLYGFLVALEETAPAAREELLHLMVERRLPSHRHAGADGGHR